MDNSNSVGEIGFLKYVVTESAEVTVELYNGRGRHVRTVLDVVKDPGEYTEEIDVSNLPSGLYFYRISIGRLTATKSLRVIH